MASPSMGSWTILCAVCRRSAILSGQRRNIWLIVRQIRSDIVRAEKDDAGIMNCSLIHKFDFTLQCLSWLRDARCWGCGGWKEGRSTTESLAWSSGCPKKYKTRFRSHESHATSSCFLGLFDRQHWCVPCDVGFKLRKKLYEKLTRSERCEQNSSLDATAERWALRSRDLTSSEHIIFERDHTYN